jgi:DNA-binding protein HU-beta
MNSSDLVAQVATATSMPKNAAEKAIAATFEAIAAALKSGDDVRIAGFGTFGVTKRSARTGRNPRTGETIEIAASSAAKFTPAKALKDAVND